MGWSLCWLAIKGKSAQAVCDTLHFRRTGTFEKHAESKIVGAELPTGWFVIHSNQTEQVVPDAMLEKVSVGCECVTCFLEEHVMYSIATGWKNGHKQWSAVHDAQEGIEHLSTQGNLPSEFRSIHDRQRAKQQEAGGHKAGVDYIFDIPVHTAQALTGYYHDRDIPGMPEEPFEILVPAIAEKASFWKRLFGA
jgi:hypothetical protein